MRVLVTGATGGLGQNLVSRLLVEGFEVTTTGRNTEIGSRLSSLGTKFIKGDLENSEDMVSACMGQDYVFHCGGFSSPWGTWQQFEGSNVMGTLNVAQACKAGGVKRLIHVSTSGVYFDFTSRRDIKEDARLPNRPASYYTKSKKMAEDIIDEANKNGLFTITLRPRGIFGPHDTALFPRLMTVANHGWIPLFNGGSAVVDLTYVENVVDALLASITAPDHCCGKKYNITNGNPVTVKEFLGNVFEATKLKVKFKSIPYSVGLAYATVSENISRVRGGYPEPKLTKYAVGLLSKDQTLDISAAKNSLRYNPRISLSDGLKLFANWRSVHD